MLACIPSATLHGVDGKSVSVELHVSNGLPELVTPVALNTLGPLLFDLMCEPANNFAQSLLTVVELCLTTARSRRSTPYPHARHVPASQAQSVELLGLDVDHPSGCGTPCRTASLDRRSSVRQPLQAGRRYRCRTAGRLPAAHCVLRT
jgi:hypothetical protein